MHRLLMIVTMAGLLSCPTSYQHIQNNIQKKRVKQGLAASYTYKKGFSYYHISAKLKHRMTGRSYRKNSYISFSDLRYVVVKYYDFHGKIRQGELVVNKAIAKDSVQIFYELFQHRYPIERMELIDNYQGDDDKSMAANNTSGFNFRLVAHTNHLSKHSLGRAIDINPRINPYITSHGISPANGTAYADRNVATCQGEYKQWMIHSGDVAHRIFLSHGFTWGGTWNTSKDYQHFVKE